MQPSSFPRPRARVLVVEDDPVLLDHLSGHLLQRGFDVCLRQTGEGVVDLVREQSFDLLLMDIMLPGSNGLEVLGRLREHQRLPVILMSALGAEQDRISGFSLGADDYLPKPFSTREMDVRIDAILRRVAYEQQPPTMAEVDPQLVFDDRRNDVSRQGQWADLTATEFRVLTLLVAQAGDVVTKAFLYQHVMHRAYSLHDRSLDMHVSRIRRKLQVIGYSAGRVETVRGTGYMLTRLAG